MISRTKSPKKPTVPSLAPPSDAKDKDSNFAKAVSSNATPDAQKDYDIFDALDPQKNLNGTNPSKFSLKKFNSLTKSYNNFAWIGSI